MTRPFIDAHRSLRQAGLLFALGLAAMLNAPFAHAAPVDPAQCSDPAAQLRLSTQSDIDTFPCSVVEGNLDINPGRSVTTPVDLTPLAGLTQVKGFLSISMTNPRSASADLSGLEGLTSAGSLTIDNGEDDTLTDISALANLAQMERANCVPSSTEPCETTLDLRLSGLTSIPDWGIAGANTVDVVNLSKLPPPRDFPIGSAGQSEYNRLPVPVQRLVLREIDFDSTNQRDRTAVGLLAQDATEQVLIRDAPNILELPVAISPTRSLKLVGLGITDLAFLSNGFSFPNIEAVALERLPGIDGSDLQPIAAAGVTELILDSMPGVDSLTALSGLPLEAVTLVDLPGLTSLAGLDGFTELDLLSLTRLAGLTDLSGLETLTRVNGGVQILSNTQLTSLNGLQNLASFGRTGSDKMEIRENPLLADLDGLSGLRGTQGGFEIGPNAQLADVSGLVGVTGILPTPPDRRGRSNSNILMFGNAIPVIGGVGQCDVLDNDRLNPPVPAANFLQDPPCSYVSPGAEASEAFLDFGSVASGGTVSRTVTLTNPGSLSTTTTITSVAIDADSLGEYSINADGCTNAVLSGSGTAGTPGDSCDITVDFTALQPGVDQAVLRIGFQTSENVPPATLPVILAASGEGQVGAQLNPNTILDFGAVERGGNAVDQITVDNSGGAAPLTVNSLSVSGLNPSDFAIGTGTCPSSPPFTLQVGETCALDIRFLPTDLNPRSANFVMESNSATSPDRVVLLGIGVLPAAPAPQASVLNFGEVDVGETTPGIPFLIANQGAANSLTLGTLAASAGFVVTQDNCSGATLAPNGQPGDTCDVRLAFSPVAPGPAVGSLEIPSVGTGIPPVLVQLLGTGLSPANLVSAPTSFDFGTAADATPPLTLTITNISPPASAAKIESVSVSGSVTPTQFDIIGDTCSGNIVPGGADCAITVAFNPTAQGADLGSVAISYNGGKTLSVPVSGTGGDPVSYVNPLRLSFGGVELGSSSAPQTVTVTDNSGVPLAISTVLSSDPAFQVSNDGCTGTTVTSGGSCTFDVTYTPLAAGAVVSTVDITSDSASSPDAVLVDGTGLRPGTAHLSPPVVDFGSVKQGANGSVSVTVTNYGDIDLVLGTLAASGDPAFSLSANDCDGRTLAARASCSFTVAFAPSAAGPASGQVTVPSIGPPSSAVPLPLIGTGLAPTAPVANADVYTVLESTTLDVPASGGVLANDVDTEGRPLTASVVSTTSSGALALSSDGSFSYQPAPGFNGVDSFTYIANNGQLDSQAATVSITVRNVNAPPLSGADAYSTPRDAVLTVDAVGGVLANDLDPDGDTLRVATNTAPANGTLQLADDGAFTYTPAAGFTGLDTFTYQATDGAVSGTATTVQITVLAANRPPVARADSFTVIEDTPINIPAGAGLLANDSDPDGNTIFAVLDAAPSQGTLSLGPDGGFAYTPAPGFSGTDSFGYRASDGLAESDTVPVILTVLPAANVVPPLAGADSYGTQRDTALAVNAANGVLANDIEPNGGTLTATAYSQPSNGSLQGNPDGSFTYLPNPGFEGLDSFTYQASNGVSSAQATVVIDVRIVNEPPVPGAPSFDLAGGAVFNSGVPGALTGASDPDGDQLTATLATGPASGVVQVNLDGSFTYTPNSGFAGQDSFTVTISDGLATATATVALNVTAPPSPRIPAPVPTLSTWATWLLVLALLGLGFRAVRQPG